MVCTSQKNRFHYPGWSIIWNIRFLDTEKLLFWHENQRKLFPLEGKCFSFKTSTMVSKVRRKPLNKNIMFSTKRNNKFPLAGMKDLFKNMFLLHRIWKKWREWFSLTRNLIYISWNKFLFLINFFYKTQ